MATRKHLKPLWLSKLLALLGTTSVLAQEVTFTEPSTIAAAYVSSSPSPTTLQSSVSVTSTSIPGPQTHTIQVGLLDHKMRPEVTEAAVGDFVEFDFYPRNHSVVRAEYGFPCIPYEMTGSGKTGFFSGFNPVDKVLDKPPRYLIRVNDTEPIFFYCSAPGSCITYGMVGGINLNNSMSIGRQRTLAMDSSYMLQPGEPFPAESPLPSGSPASSILPSSSSISTPASSVPRTSGGLSTGAIAGITIAAVLVLLGAALLFFYCGRNKSLREAVERRHGTVHRTSASPNQVLEYKQPAVHTHPHHPSQAGFRFPPHPAVQPASHPGSPDPAVYSHGHQRSMSGGYFPTPQGYDARKYASPTATHPYLVSSSESPPPGSIRLNGHPFMQRIPHDPRGGTPAPEYYETFQPHGQVQERAVEMEAIAAVCQAGEGGVNRASKF
ncbi:hypothetical protein E8E12_010048 [Didymella heteroderae]|uniref:Extracellular serine-rich protein n=1 Tax=Didymella heteroderae TaxID=1769908 RepID=A0A9P4WW80_9PLEO|nr:hypothetical protein E8E12_010048 [Didymella heteroderae]